MAKKKEPDYKALYKELKGHCCKMFRQADAEGLYLGLGKEARLPDTPQAQEGKLVKKLRKLVDQKLK